MNLQRLCIPAAVWAVTVVLVAPPAAAAEDVSALRQAIVDLHANAPAEVLGFAPREVGLTETEQDLHAVYHETGLGALWVTPDGPGKHARAVREVVTNAADEGLDPDDYHAAELSRYWSSRSPEDLARLDTLITLAFITWTNDASVGRVHPRLKHPDLFASAADRQLDSVEVVRAYLAAEEPASYLQQLTPQHRYYRGLRAALKRYGALRDSGGWSPVPDGPTLHPGDEDSRVIELRRRLAVTGEYIGQAPESAVFDDALRTAIEAFQTTHGLEPDGVVGPATLAALNVSVDDRIRQIEMNMERWRWTSHDLGNPYVMVDIAGFDLQAVVDDEVALEMPVIVGKLHHESPVFSDHIKYIEFNPFWNLTPNIARHETVPRLRRDPDYLADKHIRVFDGWGADARELDPSRIDWNAVKHPGGFKFRQDPGPWNALGTMKFVFPNEYSVYLHDTPNHSLFGESRRAFSHGCIRLSDPARLAEFILGLERSPWRMADIEAVLDSKKRTVKPLGKPLAVHLTYETAWVDGEGRLHFAPDVYGRDEKLRQALY